MPSVNFFTEEKHQTCVAELLCSSTVSLHADNPASPVAEVSLDVMAYMHVAFARGWPCAAHCPCLGTALHCSTSVGCLQSKLLATVFRNQSPFPPLGMGITTGCYLPTLNFRPAMRSGGPHCMSPYTHAWPVSIYTWSVRPSTTY